jgi:hypothetical protein
MRITRRKFLKQSLIGALAAVMAPAVLVATAKKAPAAAGTNPLFTGALGQYEGVNIIHNINSPLADLEYYAGDQWDKAQQDLMKEGSAVFKFHGPSIKDQLKAEWIPINKLHRPGGRQSKRRG